MTDKTGDEGLAQRVKFLRNKNNLTQKELAGLTDLSLQTIRKIESAERFVSKDTTQKLASAFKVSVEFLLSGATFQDLGYQGLYNGANQLDPSTESDPSYLVAFSNDPNISDEAKEIIRDIVRRQYEKAKQNSEELKNIPVGRNRPPKK